MTGADLKWANLTGADLTEADLRDANLAHANLTGVKLYKTIMPDGNIYSTPSINTGLLDRVVYCF